MTVYAFNNSSIWTPYTTKIGRLSSSYSPLGLWHFNTGTGSTNDLIDSSGNNYNLTVANGDARFVMVVPGQFGLVTRGQYTSSNAAFRILSDVTVACIVYFTNMPSGRFPIVWFDGNSTTEANNTLYGLTVNGGALEWVSEHGSNVLDSLLGDPMSISSWNMFVGRRQSNVCSLWNSGIKVAESSLTAPTGGSSSILRVCPNYASDKFWCYGISIYNYALNDSQIIELSKNVIGEQV